MTADGKEGSKKSKNGQRKEINKSVNLLMEERNEHDKRNGEWLERKGQPKWQGLELREKTCT